MTPGEMYDTVVAAIEAIAVTKAHKRDRFTHHAGSRDEMPMRDRVFIMEFLSGVDQHPSRMGCDEFVTTLEIVYVYSHSKDIQKRVGNDSKLVADALLGLIGSGDQITDVRLTSSDNTVTDDRTIISARQVEITFK
tara:strand:+ start:585 stop:992 length:408 start_codon:yes stop_codon:yes gene_type:complete